MTTAQEFVGKCFTERRYQILIFSLMVFLATTMIVRFLYGDNMLVQRISTWILVDTVVMPLMGVTIAWIVRQRTSGFIKYTFAASVIFGFCWLFGLPHADGLIANYYSQDWNYGEWGDDCLFNDHSSTTVPCTPDEHREAHRQVSKLWTLSGYLALATLIGSIIMAAPKIARGEWI